MKKIINSESLRSIALTVLIAGALVSLWMVFNAGRNNNSILLRALFVMWSISPFTALFFANKLSKLWSQYTRLTLYCLMIVIALISVFGYSGAFNSPEMKPAFKFLVIPFISWMLIVTVIPISLVLSSKNNSINKI